MCVIYFVEQNVNVSSSYVYLCDITCTTAGGSTQPRWQPTTAGDAVVTATITALPVAAVASSKWIIFVNTIKLVWATTFI